MTLKHLDILLDGFEKKEIISNNYFLLIINFYLYNLFYLKNKLHDNGRAYVKSKQKVLD